MVEVPLSKARRIGLAASQFEGILETERRDYIARVLKTLTPLEESVILHRYGVCDADVKSRRELSESLGVTEGVIRAKEQKALLRLRHPSRRMEAWR